MDGLQSLAGVATASEVASCDKPRLRQAIAAMRANEIGWKRGVCFKGWVKLGVALELAKEFKQRSCAQGMTRRAKKAKRSGGSLASCDGAGYRGLGMADLV